MSWNASAPVTQLPILFLCDMLVTENCFVKKKIIDFFQETGLFFFVDQH
jgi:hypothetical protein